MSKKKNSRPGKNQKPRNKKASGSGTAGSRRGSAVSLGAFRAEKLLALLTPGFIEWFKEVEGPEEDARGCLKVVGVVLGELLQAAPASSATSFTLEDAVHAFEALEEVFGDDVELLIDALHVYVDFLDENDLWTGTEGELAAVHDLVGGGSEIPFPDLPEILVPEIPLDQELAAFEAMPLISRTSALLEWVGTGKSVTSTGVLRLADIEAAAACVGVKARGQRQAPRRNAEALPGLDMPNLEEVDEPVLVVRSMNDVPELAMLWNSLLDAELIDVRATKVVPLAGTGFEPGANDSRKLETYRDLATITLQGLEDEILDVGPFGSALWMMHKAVFTIGCSSEPMPVDRFDLDEDLEPDDEAYLANAMANAALGMFRELEKLGLVSIDTHVRVPRHLRQIVKTVFAGMPEDFDELDEVNGFPAAAGEHEIELRRDTPPVETTAIHQLRVELQDLTPPIWRTVLVPNGASLRDLHDIIQRAFEWDNSHMHRFQKGGRNGTSYSSPSPFEPYPGENRDVDENTVALSEVFKRKGSKLEYTYDFGDSWRHLVTLEKTLSPKDAGEFPRCIDGQRMAPEEDCGGAWGWINLLDAVNDPAHPAHEDRMDWMGMEEGETLDPEKFDLAEINERLSRFQGVLG
ncbi:IS1096 element passenger TnpR family protein [Paeniglutamicibacter psychrophenolicus]|uniref:IS1096 element passenger TnpR family protein n=1 Tax=Paeniglutamicibacter psychrophenolicus TaxID=257454 RepID=UPI0027860F57|nr:hypothetical protein [Paeniglutamicibacter psychrophenolicus]MDQ0093354.1 hypothetical protein [Paeniglutamicibacter psychrophenolicus]